MIQDVKRVIIFCIMLPLVAPFMVVYWLSSRYYEERA